MLVRFYTLGCKVNQYETQALAELFAQNGFVPVQSGGADVYVVNSCTVTATADQKSRQLVRRLRREHPNAVIALTGCMPQAVPEAALRLPEADVVTGAKNRAGLLGAVTRFLREGRRVVEVAPHLPGDAFEPMQTTDFAGHTRAFLKIQDGCDKRCAYCIIPDARGPLRSKAPGDIAREVQSLAAAGFKEVVLVGINLARYGAECGLRLPDGVRAAAGFGCRVRLGSVDPVLLSQGDLKCLAELPEVCEHIHLSLQSGCEATLARMGRGYTPARYREAAEAVRRLFRNPALTTDLMVGFPGESEAEFAETLAFTREIGFADAHIFAYSPRPGTPAATRPGQVSAAEKKRRAGALADCAAESRAAFLRGQVGRVADVLFEAAGAGGATGFSRNHTPVTVPGARAGERAQVRLTGLANGACTGERLDINR